MGWHLVEKLIEQSGEHSTLIGKFWVTSVFILRLLLATSISDDVWDDAQEEFVCNTESPGCANVCFNEYSPIAVTRYWMLQILFTALPSMIFIVYTAHKLSKLDAVLKERKANLKKQREQERQANRVAKEGKLEEKDDDNDDDKVVATKLSEDAPSKLFLAYYFVVLTRMIVEVGFMVGQYYLYTFKFLMPELWQCQHWPCPQTVDCFVSRPKEKSILICAFYGTGVIMVILSLMELYHMSGNFSKAWQDRGDDITKHAHQGPVFHDPSEDFEWSPGLDYYEESLDGYPNATGLPVIRPVDRRGRNAMMGHRSRRYR